jgi:hypothetical protein
MAGTLQNVLVGFRTSAKANTTIAAGQPVDAAGNIVAADGHMLGVALNDAVLNDDIGLLSLGQCDVIAGGVITALDYVKVGTGGKFLSASAADLAAGKAVGKAATTTPNGNNDTVTILVGMI